MILLNLQSLKKTYRSEHKRAHGIGHAKGGHYEAVLRDAQTARDEGLSEHCALFMFPALSIWLTDIVGKIECM